MFSDRSSYYWRTLKAVAGERVDCFADPECGQEYFSLLKDCFENQTILKVGHNLKFEYSILAQKGITLKGIHNDTIHC